MMNNSKKSENVDKIIHNLRIWSSLPLNFQILVVVWLRKVF